MKRNSHPPGRRLAGPAKAPHSILATSFATRFVAGFTQNEDSTVLAVAGLMNTNRYSSPRRNSAGKANRAILSKSIATFLVPFVVLLGHAMLANSARAAVTATETAGILTVTLGAAHDVSTLSTQSSGSNIEVTGTGFAGGFMGVSKIILDYTAMDQAITLDTTLFPFSSAFTISATGTSGTETLTKIGANPLSLTGTDNYAGRTTVSAGALIVTNANALGTSVPNLQAGTELRSAGNVTLANQIVFANSATSTVSTSGNLVLSYLSFVNSHAVFGSAGNSGNVIINPLNANSFLSQGGSLEVAFGTLTNGGGLGGLTSIFPTTVDAGATLNVNDQSMTAASLLGTGMVNLGKSAATTLTMGIVFGGGTFGGVISGAGHVNAAAISNSVVLTGTNTYTGGTTIVPNSKLQIGNNGTTGSIVGNVTNNGILSFNRKDAVTFAGNITGSGYISKDGLGTLTLTGTGSNYTGGTDIDFGMLSFKGANALGNGNVYLSNPGAELNSAQTVTLPDQVSFNGLGTSTISATTGTTLTLLSLKMDEVSGPMTAVFGSAGHTGTIVVGPLSFSSSAANPGTTSLEVAFGTLRNGAAGSSGLGYFTNAVAVTNLDAGATLDVHDFSMEVKDFRGAGAVNLGTNAATTLTVDAGYLTGVISGKGQLIVGSNGSGSLELGGANTYTGGTTVNSGAQLQIDNSITGNVVNNGSILFLRGSSFTFAGNITGSGSIDLYAGAGTSTLTGTGSSYSGGTLVEGGVLSFKGATALGTGSVTINPGTELNSLQTAVLANQVVFSPFETSTISAASGTTLTLSSLKMDEMSGLMTAAFGSAGHTGTVIVGPLTGSPATPANPSNTTLEVAFGTLRNGAAGSNGLGFFTSAVGTTTVNAGATLDVHDFNTEVKNLQGAGAVTLGTNPATVLTLDSDYSTGTFGGTISGAGQVNVVGNGGFVILTGSSTYTGGTTISSMSRLQIGNGGTTGSIAGNVTDNNFLIFMHSNAFTFAGNITGSGFISQVGAGTLTLTGAGSNYSGGTFLGNNLGMLSFKGSNALGTGGIFMGLKTELNSAQTATLANQVVFSPAGTSTISAAAGTTLTLNSLKMDGIGSGIMMTAMFGSAGHTGTVVVGPVTGSAANPGSTTLEVAFGTLRNGAAGNSTGLGLFTSTVGTTTVNAGATLDVDDFNLEVLNLQGAGAITLGMNAATALTLDGGTYNGVISGKGQLIVNNNDSFVLTGANTYTGGTTINSGGSLQIGNGGTTGSITGNVVDNGSIVFLRSDSFTFAGNITGSGKVVKYGAGTLTLTGTGSTYTGGTTINSGVVAINNGSALGTGTVTLKNGNVLLGTANLTLSNEVDFPVDTTATIAANGGTTFTVTSLQWDGNVHAVFGNAGHTGTVVVGPLTGGGVANASSIEVAFGTLRNGAADNDHGLGFYTSDDTTTVDAGATLDVHDSSMGVGNLVGAGAVTLGSSAATVLSLGGSNFSGVISGKGQVSIGNGILTGANTYTGGTNIDGFGSLQMGNGGTTGSIAGNVANFGTLTFDRSDALTFPGTISGTGSVVQAGAGVLTLTAVNTYTGGTTINSGLVAISNGSALGTGKIILATGTMLQTSTNMTLSNEVDFATSGNSTVAAAAGTTLILSQPFLAAATNAIFGSPGKTGVVQIGPLNASSVKNTSTVAVAVGTLRNGGTNFTGLGALTVFASSTTVASGATLDVHDFDMTVANLQGAGALTLGTSAATMLTLDSGTFGGVMSGKGQVTKATAGNLTLSGANTFSGGTTIDAGTLLANSKTGSATGTGPVAINSGATLGGSGTVSGAVTLNGGGSIAPGAGTPGVPGTLLHAASLIWNPAAALTLQLGTAGHDELILTGALTKGTTGSGSYSVDITDDGGIPHGDYTLATFASTTFASTDFTLNLPGNYVGSLSITNGKNLVLDLTAGSGQRPARSLGTESTPDDSQQDLVPPPPTPEPASGILLALGGTALLGWRRRSHR